MNRPLVSVVIATHNRAHCVGRAIDSILSQTFRDFEVVVVDDGSTDGTVDVLRGYGDAIRVIRREHHGIAAARNAGTDAARGEFIAVIDSDDTAAPERLEATVRLFEKYPDIALAFGGYDVVDPDGNVLHSRDFRNPDMPFYVPPGQEDMRFEDFYPVLLRWGASISLHGTNTIRKSSLVEIGGYDTSYSCSVDLRMQLTLARRHPFACTCRILYKLTRGLKDHMSASAGTAEQTVFNNLRICEEELTYVMNERSADAPRLISILEDRKAEEHLELATERIGGGRRSQALEALRRIHPGRRNSKWLRLWCIAQLPAPLASAARRVKGLLGMRRQQR